MNKVVLELDCCLAQVVLELTLALSNRQRGHVLPMPSIRPDLKIHPGTGAKVELDDGGKITLAILAQEVYKAAYE